MIFLKECSHEKKSRTFFVRRHEKKTKREAEKKEKEKKMLKQILHFRLCFSMPKKPKQEAEERHRNQNGIPKSNRMKGEHGVQEQTIGRKKWSRLLTWENVFLIHKLQINGKNKKIGLEI